MFEAELRKNYDNVLDLGTGIEQFGYRHMIGRRLLNHMHVIAEELCINTIMPILDSDEVISLVFEYSDRDGGFKDAHLTYHGDNNDPMKGADELSEKLIRNSCKDMTWERDDGQCSINCRLV